MNDSRQTEAVAAAWLARRDSGFWNESDQHSLTAWLQASTTHRIAYLRLEAAWRQADRLAVLGAGGLPGVVPAPGGWSPSPVFDPTAMEAEGASASVRELCAGVGDVTHPHASRSWRALAAAALVAAVSGIGWYLWPEAALYHTEVGGLASVPMPDGSNVTLNTDSEIRVAVTDTERRVRLEHGEAFFEVARDPSRPFVVYAGEQRVIAVGTKFAVRRESGEIRVVVTEGRVRVESTKGGGKALATQLSAGAVALTGEAGTLVQERQLAEEVLSWRRGFLVFRETPLGEAVAEFNRYNARKVVIDDPAIAAIQIGGSFRSTNVDAFVRLLERGFEIRAERRDRQIILKAA